MSFMAMNTLKWLITDKNPPPLNGTVSKLDESNPVISLKI
jgi:hypothetical protein